MQNNTLTQLKCLTHIKVSRKESQAIAIAKSLLRASIHKSRSPAAGIVAPGSERCIAEILIWIGSCSLPQHHSVLLKMHYFMLEVVDKRKPVSIISTLAVYEFETYIEGLLSVMYGYKYI